MRQKREVLLKRSVVNAAMMLKKPAASSKQPAAAAAAAREPPASRSGSRTPGTASSTWSKKKKDLEDKTAELEETKKKLEDRRVELGVQRGLREVAEKEATHANQQLEFIRRQNKVIVDEKVKRVLEDIEHDACPNCQKLFRKSM